MNQPDFSAFGIESHWLQTQPGKRRLLVIYAHPDDESFGNAGTIARYAAEGVSVHYACATRGECGSVAPDMLTGYPDIATLRTAELMAAARVLKMAGVHFLGYRDSGMENTEENRHPDALVQAPKERVVGQLVALIRGLQPQVVLTFPPYGGYGHPDHIAIHQATLVAWEAAGDPLQFPEQIGAGLTPWKPQKLYYSTFAVGLLKAGIRIARLLGKDPSRVGENKDIDLTKVAVEATPVTTTVDYRPFMILRDHACYAHRSQLGGMSTMLKLPRWFRRLITGTESFTRVQPPVTGKGQRERDLFAGL